MGEAEIYGFRLAVRAMIKFCVVVIIFFAVFVVGLVWWVGAKNIEKKSYENVQQIRMYSPDRVTILVKTADKKIEMIDFQDVRPIIIEDAPIDGPIRVEYKDCDALGLRGCVEMHVHSLKDVESWKRVIIPLPDE